MSNHFSRARVASWFKWHAVLVVAVVCVAVFAAVRGVDAQQTAGRVNAVAFADARVAVAVGDKGFVRRTEDGGNNWTNIEANVKATTFEYSGNKDTAKFNDVVFADATHGIIVGTRTISHGFGLTLLTDDAGKTWREAPAALPREAINPDDLQSVSYPDKQHARVVGEAPVDNGVLIKTDDGATFQRLPTNTQDVLRGVSFVDANTGWIVGDNGTILHTKDGGNTFELQGDGEDKTNHRGVFFLDNGRGWIVGDGGDMHRTTNGGATWEKSDAGTTANLKVVRFSDANNGFAVADGGAVLNSKDGGATWQSLSIADGIQDGVIARRADNAIVLVGQSSKSPTPTLAIDVLQEGNANAAQIEGATSSNQTTGGAAQIAPSPAATPSIYERVRETPTPIGTRLIGFVGVIVLLGAAYLMSSNRRAIRWSIVAWGLGLQLVFAVFIMRTRIGFLIFNKIGEGVKNLLAFSDAGAQFVFGRLADPAYIQQVGSTLPDSIAFANRFGLIFAFKILPTIIFVASLFAILYYLGIMQRIVYAMAWVMSRTMRVSGAESLSSAANVFMGQTEAPLVIAPYIRKMTQSELLAVMIGGMATVSGGVLAAYIGLGVDPVFLLTGSVMAAPASLMIAKMLYPETETPETAGSVKITTGSTDANLIDAASRGAGEGMQLAINVAAMLIAFIALIALVNAILGYVGYVTGINDAIGRPFGLSLIFGYLFAPLAFVMGVPASDIVRVGDLFGTKLVLNEFVAYLRLSPAGENVQALLQPRSILIVTYALCGFANFSSIGIQIGGIGGLAPERRSDLARLGLRALFGGFIATCITATIAGILS